MGDLPESGATAELKPLASNSTSFKKNWGIADRAIREIIRKVQPTSVSEEKRRDVIDYIQRLIRNYLGAEVLPYGSVPLKTYLPDGDIDLTAFGGGNAEDTLADDMKSILKGAGEFAVKDVQLIRAEVKLVKCIVQDIVVDVSFNQIGGLCTLCFLEQVDRFISKDHLFKHSIILIKAWCYYESRILGAHHGLISTYALETLVLYIFHFFHSILDGPLAVLYKFLDYFSKFDWETYCISLNGPIRLSSLPAIIAEIPEGSDRELLLTSDFLSSCVGTFSVPSRGSDTRGFQRKHLNIVDPLKENNNLGRSVSQGNFYRIRSAFSLGARKLTRILQQPEDTIDNELQRFFSNTTGRHGGGQRHDIRDFNLDPSLVHNSLVSAVPIPVSGLRKIDYSDEHTISSGDFQSGLGKSSQDLLKGTENISDIANLEQYNSSLLKHPSVLPDRDHSPKPNGLDSRLHGDSTDLATSGLGDLKISTDLLTGQSPSSKESGNAVIKPYFAPHLYFPNSKWHDHNTGDGNSDSDKLDKCKKNASSLVSLGSDEGRVAVVGSLDENHLVDRDEPVASSKAKDAVSATKSSSSSVDHNHTDPGQGSASRSEMHESSNSFDLTGDYDSFMQCLQYGRWFYDYGLGMHSLPMPPLPIPPYRNSLWDGIVPLSYKQNGFSHRHHNGFHPSPPLYPVQPVLLPGVAFGWEEVPKPRGTGTYFPNTNQPPLGYRSSSMKGRNQAPSRSPRNNGRNIIFVEPNMIDRSSYELSQPQLPLDRSMMISSPDSYLSYSPHGNGYPNANGLFIQPEAVVEFELVGHAPGTPGPEQNRQQRTAASSSPRTLSGMQRSQSAFREQDRISLRSSYHLKDEDDFPPLPV